MSGVISYTGTIKSKSGFNIPQVRVSKHEKLSDAEFLDLAVGDESKAEAIQVSHKNWSADGFRLHFLNDKEDSCKCKYCKNRDKGEPPMSPDYHVIIPVKFRGEFKINRDAILDAGNTCKVFAREGSNLFEMLVGQEKINFRSSSEEIGESNIEYGLSTKVNKNYVEKTYTYSKTGEDIRIAFNIDFVLDAMIGMSEFVTIKYNRSTMPILVTDGKRSVVIMPIYLG